MRVPSYEPMAKILQEGECGDAKIQHVSVSPTQARMSSIRSMFSGDSGDAVTSGTYAHLRVKGRLVMSDTRMERNTNYEFLRHASLAGGDILVGGLGLGMILVPLAQMRNVLSITVIEKSSGVIELVESSLRSHLNQMNSSEVALRICQGDILEWKPPKGRKWDVIYFDIWPDICMDNLVGITKLKRKFGRRLNRDNLYAWMGAWMEKRLRYIKHREAKHRILWR